MTPNIQDLPYGELGHVDQSVVCPGLGERKGRFGRAREERGPFVLKTNATASSEELSKGREKHQEGQCMRRVPVGETHMDILLWFMRCAGVVFFFSSDHEVYVG